MTELLTPPFLIKLFKYLTKQTHYFIYLFTALSSSACTSHKLTTFRNCCTYDTAFNGVHAVDSAVDGERVLAPAYGPQDIFVLQYAIRVSSH